MFKIFDYIIIAAKIFKVLRRKLHIFAAIYSEKFMHLESNKLKPTVTIAAKIFKVLRRKLHIFSAIYRGTFIHFPSNKLKSILLL